MTRKRFVKLCMAKGFSRNEANKCARSGIAFGCTYQILLDMYPACEAVAGAINRLRELVVEMIPSIIQGIVELAPELVTNPPEDPDNSQQL